MKMPEGLYRRMAQTLGDDLVFGEGPDNAPPLLLVGEAPGEQEQKLRRPFVGKAGKNLTEFLDAVALSREDIFITNVVKRRPTRISSAGRVVNRPPNREELKAFTPFLLEEIGLVCPGAVVTLGNVPLQALMGEKTVIGDCHGTWQRVTLPNGQSFPLFPLYHPAAVIYNRSLTEVYRRDVQTLYDTMKEVIGR